MDVKCEITKQKVNIDQARKTTDGKWVSTDLYIRAVDELRKGALELVEITDILALLKEFSLKLGDTLLGMKRKAYIDSTRSVDAIINLLKEEQKYSLEKYNKNQSCMTRQECMEFFEDYSTLHKLSELTHIGQDTYDCYNHARIQDIYLEKHGFTYFELVQ